MSATGPHNRAWRCHAFGAYHDLVLERLPMPQPSPGEVVIRNRAFALGFPDMLTVQGLYQYKPPVPFVPGAECAGEVVALGAGVSSALLGQAVMVSLRVGAAADFIVVSAAQCREMPTTLDFVHAAAFTIGYKTAHVALSVRGGLCRGETLLVHGAAGGVGLAAVELGHALGAKVIAMATGAHKLKVLRERGADHVLDYADGSFRERVKALTGGRGVDVVYDPVGGDVFDESLRCIAPFGRVLVIGFASGRIPQAAVNQVLIKQIAIVGVRAGEYGRQNPAGGAEVDRALAQWAASGRLIPHVHAVLPFSGIIDAFDALRAREVIGRIVIQTDT